MLRPGPPVFVDVGASFSTVQLAQSSSGFDRARQSPPQKRGSKSHPLLLPLLHEQTQWGSLPAIVSPDIRAPRRKRTGLELPPSAIRSLQEERMVRSGIVSPEDILPSTSSQFGSSVLTSTPSDGWMRFESSRSPHDTHASQRRLKRCVYSDGDFGEGAESSQPLRIPQRRRKRTPTDDSEVERKFWPQSFVVRKEGMLSPEQMRSKDLRACLASLRRVGDKPAPPQLQTTTDSGDSASAPAAPVNGGAVEEPSGATVDDGAGALEELLNMQVAAAADISAEAPVPVPQVAVPAEPEDGPMWAVLKNCNDTSDNLQGFIDVLTSGAATAADLGGARHASTVVSFRTLSVARRKWDLLREVESRIAAFEVAHDQREELLQALIEGDAEVPEALQGVKKYIAKYTSPINPADGDKTDFVAFCKTFLLPGAHQHLNRLRDLCLEVGEWWARACVKEAIDGAGHAVLTRIFNVAVGSGCDQDHPKLIHAMMLLTNRLADRVLQEAQERKDRDTEMAEVQELPPLGPASVMADKIDVDVQKAIKEGVKAKDERLVAALAIAKYLREQDGKRKRLHAREKKLKEQAAKANK